MVDAPKKDAILMTALDRFAEAETAWSDDRARYEADVRFAAGDQWPREIRQARENKRRPCLTVDKLGQYIRQVVNDARQNRPSVNVDPVDDKGDPDVAKILQGLIRHVEYSSTADVAYDTALECAVTGGFGFIRVLTEYAHDATFEQDIVIKRVRNPLTVWLDPNSTEPNGSDCRWAFVTDDIPRKDYRARFPKAPEIDFDSSDLGSSNWFGDNVRVAEYWYVEDEDRNLHLMADGSIATDEEIALFVEETGAEPPMPVETRVIPQKCVYWCRMNGADIIEKPQKWLGKWIPIVPVWGNERDIDGEVQHTGLIHSAKDAQTLYNFSRTAFAERVALAPKAPYLAAAGQIEDYQDEWNTANETNLSVLKYDPIDISGHPVPPPMRQQASDIPAGFAEDMRLSEHDIQGSLGMYEASLGQKSNERTGVAIRARQGKADTGTFHYHDNLNRSIHHIGRILIDLIPKVYDTQRVIRALGEDGAAEQVQINPEQEQAVQKVADKTIYNLGVGRYDVTVKAGPSYSSLRQEAAEHMSLLMQTNPDLMMVFGDVWLKNQDWPGASDAAERMKAVLNPQVLAMLSQDQNIPPEAMPVIQSMQQQLEGAKKMFEDMQGQMQGMQQENEVLKQGMEVKAKEAAAKDEANKIDAFEAETKRITALANVENGKRDMDLKIRQMVSDQLDSMLTKESNDDAEEHPDQRTPVQ